MPPTPSTILVTGATGGVGSALMNALSTSPARVIAGSRSGEAVAGREGRAVDFADPAGLERAFAGVDAVFLLFPLVPEKLAMARNAVSAAKRAGVAHLVRSSGAGADPASPHALGRLQGEIDAVVTGGDIPATLLRPNSFMQNFVTYFAGMVKGGALYFAHGDAKTSYIDVRDIAAVAAAALHDPAAHAGKTYTLTGPEALGDAEVAQIIASATGRPLAYVAVPGGAAIDSMKSMGMGDWTVDMMASLNDVVSAGHAAGVSADVIGVTGRPPRSFADFAREHVGAWT